MTQNRPPSSSPDNAPTQTAAEVLSSFKAEPFNTRDILVRLYKNLMKLDGIPDNDPILARGILIDDKMASAGNALYESPNRLLETAQEVTLVLDELKQERQVSHEQFQIDYLRLKDRVGPLNEEREALKRKYQELVSQQLNAIRGWLNEHRDGNKSVEAIMQEFKNFQLQQIEFTTRVKAYLEQHKTLQDELDTLHTLSYKSAKEKAHLKQPRKLEVATPRIT